MNNSVKQALDEVVAGFDSKETIVWCGSGISRNSGIPVVRPFLEYLLNKIEIEELDRKTILESNLPFEKLMEIINENCNADRLFDIYDADKPQKDFIRPNTNHILLAKLAKEKKLKVIVTTNFDQLIEKALQNEGNVEGKDYEVIYKEEDFNRIKWRSDKIILIKIHGSIRDRKNMVITLKKVAQKELSAEREKVVKNVFSENNDKSSFTLIKSIFARSTSSKNSHKNVLILGYSSSDVFDLCPQIESIEDKFKNVYYIEHIDKNEIPSIESIKDKTDKNPFKKFNNSYRIYFNTDKFIENIWDKIILNANYELIEKSISWQLNIDVWFKTIAILTKYLLSFRILYEISELKRSIIYAERALAIAKQNGDKYNEAIWLSSLGNVYSGLAEYYKALEYYELALKIAEEIGDKNNTRLFLENMAIVYIRLGDNKKAMEYSSKATEIEKKFNNSKNEKRESASKGAICYRLGEYDKAIKHFQEMIDTAVETGDKKREGMGLGNLGAVYWRLENYVEAKRYIKNALEISVSIGDKSSECKWIGNLGNIYINSGQYEKGIEYFKTALAIAEEIGDNYSKVLWLGNLGDAYNALKDNNNAKRYCEQALEISRQLGDKDSEIANLAVIGHVHYNLKEYKMAIEYYEKAIKIAVEIGSKHMHGRLLACIGNVYTDLDDNNFFSSADNLEIDDFDSEYYKISVNYYKKALYILVPLLGGNHPEVKDIKSYI